MKKMWSILKSKSNVRHRLLKIMKIEINKRMKNYIKKINNYYLKIKDYNLIEKC